MSNQKYNVKNIIQVQYHASIVKPPTATLHGRRLRCAQWGNAQFICGNKRALSGAGIFGAFRPAYRCREPSLFCRNGGGGNGSLVALWQAAFDTDGGYRPVQGSQRCLWSSSWGYCPSGFM